MAQGSPIIILRKQPLPEGKEPQIMLRPMMPTEADRLFPLYENDEQLSMLEPVMRGVLMARDGNLMRHAYQDDPECLLWGIATARQLVGFVTLRGHIDSEDMNQADRASFGVAIRPEVYGRGIGTLASAAMVAAACEPGYLHRQNSFFAHDMFGISTAVHPNNEASAQMVERAGLNFMYSGLMQGVGFIHMYGIEAANRKVDPLELQNIPGAAYLPPVAAEFCNVLLGTVSMN